MTSAKSSVNPFRFTLARTMRKNFHFPAIIGVIIFVLSACFGIFAKISDYKSFALENQTLEEYFSDTMFILGNGGMNSEFYTAAMMLLAMASAITTFSYMMSKKSVNVYYSLGISRRDMFLAKYLSGATLLALAVLIPMLITLITNLIIFGSSVELWESWLFYVLGTSLSLIFAYSVATAVCCRVGTVIESIVYGGVMLILPVVITYVAEFLFRYFVYGSPSHECNWVSRWSGSLIYTTGNSHYFNFPLTYDTVPFADVVGFNTSLDRNYAYSIEPNFLSLIPLAVLVAAVFAVALFTYKNRKTEIAGFLGADNITKGISVFAISAVIITFVINELIYFESGLALFCAVLTVIVFAAVYLFFEIITVHNIKGILKGSWKFAVHMGIVALCIAAFSGGLFGYSSRMPDADDIESAAISTGTGDLYLNYRELSDMKSNSGANDTAEYYLLTGFGNLGITDGFTSQKDIQSILEIHEKFIECKNLKVNEDTLNAEFGERVIPVKIEIIYTLKDGTTFERMYPVATDEIMQMLAELTESERYKEMVIDSIKAPVPQAVGYAGGSYYVAGTSDSDSFVSVETVEVESFSEEMPFTFRSSETAIVSPALSSITYIPQLAGNTDLKNALLEAICKDIENNSLPLNFASEKEVVGYIAFGDYRSSEETVDDHNIRRQGGTLLNPEITEPQKLNAFGGEFKLCAYDRVPIPVYADMSNTLKVLEDNRLTVYFSESSKPVKIRVWKPDEQAIAEEETYMGASMLWSGWWYNTDETDMLIPGNAISVTDASEIEKYLKASKLMCLTCYETYFAEMIFEDGGRTFAAIPAQLIK